ncbi:MAG TPA: hypothetical protein VF008_22145 [Niastella sp.]
MLLGLPGIHLNAQQTISSDSIYLYEQTSRQQEWAHYSSTQLLFRDFRNVARSQLYGGHEQGSFHKSQEAYQQTVAGFHTDGVKTLGRFTLAGQFDFEKRWEDSAAWWNGGEYNEAQPYYFFAGKAGKYEKQLYNLSAIAAYNLWKNKLYLGMNGNYRYHWTTRSVDPRPDVKEFSTLLRPEITGRFRQHIAGAGLLWGRGNEDTDIGYANKNYSGNQLYLDRNNIMSLGFGNIGKMDRYIRRYNKTNGFFVQYVTTFKSWSLQTGGEYELWQEDITLDSFSTRNRHSLYAFLQQDKTAGNLLLTHTRNKSQQQWELQFTTLSMLNWSIEFNATSYQYTATESRITYRQLWKKNNGMSVELGAGCEYKDQLKEDIVASHKYQLQVITPHVYAGVYRQATNKSWLSLRVTPSFRHTLTNELTVPVTQENYFTQGVVYTDYLYWQKNSWGVATQFDLIQKEKPKRHRIGCTFKVKWQQTGEAAQTTLPALYIPSGSRWNAAASINLYL